MKTTTKQPTNINPKPRTVQAVHKLVTQMNRYDTAHAVAAMNGDMATMASCEVKLLELDNTIANINDNLWAQYCDTYKAVI